MYISVELVLIVPVSVPIKPEPAQAFARVALPSCIATPLSVGGQQEHKALNKGVGLLWLAGCLMSLVSCWGLQVYTPCQTANPCSLTGASLPGCYLGTESPKPWPFPLEVPPLAQEMPGEGRRGAGLPSWNQKSCFVPWSMTSNLALLAALLVSKFPAPSHGTWPQSPPLDWETLPFHRSCPRGAWSADGAPKALGHKTQAQPIRWWGVIITCPIALNHSVGV